tara:strand:+ start:6598 stop:9018 length:2421 start_codon:yes stop_codon:yes gene_type:complete
MIKDSINKDIVIFNEVIDESINLLEWPKICNHIASFSSTKQGANSWKDYTLPDTIEKSRVLLGETSEIQLIDQSLDGGISFYGVSFIDDNVNICKKGGVINGLDLIEIANTLNISRQLKRQLENTDIRPNITKITNNIINLIELEREIRLGIEDTGRIADSASNELAKLRENKLILRSKRLSILEDFIRRNLAILQDKTIINRHNRSVLAIKAEFTNRISGIIYDTSSSGNTVFIEPRDVIEITNKLSEVENNIIIEEKRLLANWSKLISDNYDYLIKLSNSLLRLENALTRSRYSEWINGYAPIFDDNAIFDIQNFRHPILLWQYKKLNQKRPLPISFEINRGIKVISITGPNTGGKTVALKSIGIALLLARSGIFIPSDQNPRLPWCKNIFLDIGDSQSLENNLSTFSGHIIRINKIISSLQISNGLSIVLLDEVGVGTDPVEGAAIALAILNKFADISDLTVATTHFGEIKALKYKDSRFENASVLFDYEKLKPLYSINWGIPGRSNALLIAEKIGLESSILINARTFLDAKDFIDVNDIIKGLEEERDKQQRSSEEAAALIARTEILYDELQIAFKNQQKYAEHFKEKLKSELAQSIKIAQQEVRDIIKSLRAGSLDGELARQSGKRLKRIKENYLLDENLANLKDNLWFPKVGEIVRIKKLNNSGEVISISQDCLTVTLKCGIFRSVVDVSSLESLDGKTVNLNKNSEVIVRTNFQMQTNSFVKSDLNTIDIRGMRVAEAEIVVQDKIRNMHGPTWIIHGIGSGKLKTGIRHYLSKLSYIEKIEDAKQEEGGLGCSVIWVK